MKRMFVLMFLMALMHSPLRAQEEALEYLKTISDHYEEVVKAQWHYARSVVDGSDYDREKSRLISTLDDMISEIRSIPPYGKDRTLQDSLMTFLNLTRRMVKEDYTKLADLQTMEDKDFAELDEFLTSQEKAYKRLASLAVSLRKAEEKFARDHGIRLVKRDDRFARRLTELNDLFTYYNSIYLPFYKGYSQELVAFKAIETRDAAVIRKELVKLEATTAESLRTVRHIGGYKGDRSLYTAAVECLTFFHEEASASLLPMLNYYDMLDRLEMLKKQRQEGARNAEEYNELVREINTASQKLNLINETLNTRRARLLYDWNTVSSTFLTRQLP